MQLFGYIIIIMIQHDSATENSRIEAKINLKGKQSRKLLTELMAAFR